MVASSDFAYRNPKRPSLHEGCRCLIVPGLKDKTAFGGYEPDVYRKGYDLLVKRGEHGEIVRDANGIPVFKSGLVFDVDNARVVDRYDLVSASFNFMSKFDICYKKFNLVQPEEGYTDYAVHCDGYSFNRFGPDVNDSQPISPKELAVFIKSDIKYDGGPIRLLACSAGKKQYGAAKMLANILGVKVKAPIDDLFVDEFGNMAVASTKEEARDILRKQLSTSDRWKVFDPDKFF